MAEKIASFEDLEVYRLSLELQQEIFRISKKFPKEETDSLTDQIRRSSRSIGANIGEAWAKRRYSAHVISKLSDSDGEQNETRHWLKSAFAREHVGAEAFENLTAKCKCVGRMLGKMMQHPDDWTPLDCRL